MDWVGYTIKHFCLVCAVCILFCSSGRAFFFGGYKSGSSRNDSCKNAWIAFSWELRYFPPNNVVKHSKHSTLKHSSLVGWWYMARFVCGTPSKRMLHINLCCTTCFHFQHFSSNLCELVSVNKMFEERS